MYTTQNGYISNSKLQYTGMIRQCVIEYMYRDILRGFIYFYPFSFPSKFILNYIVIQFFYYNQCFGVQSNGFGVEVSFNTQWCNILSSACHSLCHSVKTIELLTLLSFVSHVFNLNMVRVFLNICVNSHNCYFSVLSQWIIFVFVLHYCVRSWIMIPMYCPVLWKSLYISLNTLHLTNSVPAPRSSVSSRPRTEPELVPFRISDLSDSQTLREEFDAKYKETVDIIFWAEGLVKD